MNSVNMNIVIAGGSGLIGRHLTEFLVQQGHQVTILTRRIPASTSAIAGVSYVSWLNEGAEAPEKHLPNIDAIINLAGVSINDGRWTKQHQQRIYNSRMVATDELIRIVAMLTHKPSVWINASAIGIYPASLEAEYTEQAIERAQDFLGRTVHDWENKANKAEQFGIRTVMMRLGVVLSRDGGALPLMSLPYRLFAGGTMGSGKQPVSWIHIHDVVRAFSFALENDQMKGPVNMTAPSPVSMREFGQMVGKVLKRPHWFPVPSLLMKIVLGEKSQLVLEGQKVIPQVLLDQQFEFSFPTLDAALVDLLAKE